MTSSSKATPKYKKPSIKAYRGYTSDKLLFVFGHVFEKPLPSLSEKRRFKHAFSVIRNFRRKTIANADVFLKFNQKLIHTKTLSDGYFHFTVPLENPLPSGWHSVELYVHHHHYKSKTTAEIFSPYQGKYVFISDIDDTFLVSHTQNIFKKLYILLWKNVHDRKYFEDVTAHYQLLSRAAQEKHESNAFFYVSSSEWNLYSFIVKFTQLNHLPKAVLKLKPLKTSLWDFLMTGRGSHEHKFYKIKDIIESYPQLNYVLLGDDSQADPKIYEQICKIFPNCVKAVYIRQTQKQPKQRVQQILTNLESLDVRTCYFQTSKEAIAHSKEIGLI